MVQTIMSDFPDYLPNTYDQYYLYPDYKVQHLNPNFTRADEVMAGREQHVFSECDRIAEAGTAEGNILRSGRACKLYC